MIATHTIVESPVGPLTLRATDGVLSGLFLPDHRRGPAPDALGERDVRGFGQVVEQLAEYFAGDRRAFNVALAPAGTPFQQQVWRALLAVPYGVTRTYGDLAGPLGGRTRIRAVGMANARNPISIVIPCHRVVGADGSLTGYAGGLAVKRYLLDLESPAGSPGRLC